MIRSRYLRTYLSTLALGLLVLSPAGSTLQAAMRLPSQASAEVLSHAPDTMRAYNLRVETAAIGLLGSAAWLIGIRLRRKLGL